MGYQCCIVGEFCCIADYLKQWSLVRSIKDRRGPIYNIIISDNQIKVEENSAVLKWKAIDRFYFIE